MDQPDREHPELGRVRWNGRLNRWQAQVEIASRHSIELSIIVEEPWTSTDPEALFAIAADFLPWARTAEPSCRATIADRMLDTYNNVWADDDPEEGLPPLDRDGFMDLLRLSGIEFSPSGEGDWFYSEGGMFGDHCLWVAMTADREFTRVMMVG